MKLNYFTKKTYYWILGILLFLAIITSFVSLGIFDDIIVLVLILIVIIGYGFYLLSIFYYFKNCGSFFESEIIDSLSRSNSEVQVLKISFSNYQPPVGPDSFSFKPIVKFGGYINDSYEQFREVLILNKTNGIENKKLVKVVIEFNKISSIEIIEEDI